jgi:hypothetical protein
MKMKTNRRSKRIKNARRNRRFRRTQRGGGRANDAMLYYKTECIKACHDNRGPNDAAFKMCIDDCGKVYQEHVPHDGVDEATANGWYIDFNKDDLVGNMLHLLHTSWDPVKKYFNERRLIYRVTPEIAANLDKMPDPTKTYVVDDLHLRLDYKRESRPGFNLSSSTLQWLDQHNKIHPFNINSPLKIGDKMAVELK